MSVNDLLMRLQRVRKTGQDRWLACCPAHESQSGSSLAIRELADGRVLVHDFGGCGVADVLGAVGLEFDALYPPRLAVDESKGDRRYRSRVRQPYLTPDVLAAVAGEALLVAVAVADVAEGIPHHHRAPRAPLDGRRAPLCRSGVGRWPLIAMIRSWAMRRPSTHA